MTLFPVSRSSQAYVDGFKSGKADRLLGQKLDVSFYGTNSLNEYVREYSRGYRQAVFGLTASHVPNVRAKNVLRHS